MRGKLELIQPGEGPGVQKVFLEKMMFKPGAEGSTGLHQGKSLVKGKKATETKPFKIQIMSI